MAAEGVDNLIGHFLPQHKLWLRNVGCSAWGAEDRRCAPGPTTSWAQTIVCSRTWRSRTHGTTRTINWSLVASAEPRLPLTQAISVNVHISPSSHRRPQTGSTACLLSSGRTFPSHPGGNASVRRGYHRKPGVSLMPGFWNAGPGTSGTLGGSAAKSRRSSKKTGAEEQPRKDQQ